MVSQLQDKTVQRKRKLSSNRKMIPYPAKYSSENRNFDILDHMFLVKCCRSLTMHQFETPPLTVLDLACGSGYWAIEAGRTWTDSCIVGFDISDMQPTDSHLVPPNVQWIHGDMLTTLPFPSGHFDYVRMVGVGLAVPENEWNHVLEEASRVLKPGCAIEIVEDDLIFPCATPQPLVRKSSIISKVSRTSHATSIPLHHPTPWELLEDHPTPWDLLDPPEESQTGPRPASSSFSSTLSSFRSQLGDGSSSSHVRSQASQELRQHRSLSVTDSSSSLPSRSSKRRTAQTDIPPLNSRSLRNKPSLAESTIRGPLGYRSQVSLIDPSAPSRPRSLRTQISTLHLPDDFPPPMGYFPPNPQDHSKLKAAWDEMLAVRFLTPAVVSVLPFYLSSIFCNVKAHQTLKFSLPSNSPTTRKYMTGSPSRSPRTKRDSMASQFSQSSSLDSDDASEIFVLTATSRASVPKDNPDEERKPSTNSSPLHLAKTVQTVISCRDAIFAQWMKIYEPVIPSPVSSPPLSPEDQDVPRTIPMPGPDPMKIAEADLRDEFEIAWSNWRTDMEDRIGSRERISALEILGDRPKEESPDWRVWRDSLMKSHYLAEDVDICRTLRGFVAWKPQ